MQRQSKDAPDQSAVIRTAAFPLLDPSDEARIARDLSGARIVLLGEATHGTQEFYALRARLTRALIEQHRFSAVAIEGDWPDAYEVNRLVTGADGPDATARGALAGFQRFPTWMWRNTAVAEFVTWLRARNAAVADPQRRAGFYGLDLYSLHASMRAVVEYLEVHDPVAAKGARTSYGCFEDFGADPDDYAWATARLGHETCQDAVARELVSLQQRRSEFLRIDGAASTDEYFFAVQNARVARSAEQYYRSMGSGRVSSWNLRDQHMAETLEELLQHLKNRGQPPKVVVWAHNSHLGDARATEMGDHGELNLGQLVRQKYGYESKLVGFTTYRGSVMAASDWGEPGRLKRVRPAMDVSFEALFHETGVPAFYLPIERGTYVHSLLAEPRLERAIGVIYRPDTERMSHYFKARLSEQFDAVIHFDETRAVEPLDEQAVWAEGEAPETFPTGM